MRTLRGMVCSLALIAMATAGSARPRAQYSVADIVGTFGCEAGLVEDADGECRPPERVNTQTRGFSLRKPGQPTPPARRPPPRTRNLLITFANNSAQLTPQAQTNARVFADALNTPRLATARFAIEGHTNAVGSAESNLALSRRRAAALADQLVLYGVDRGRLDIAGYGFEHPIARDPRAAANRRVEARRVDRRQP